MSTILFKKLSFPSRSTRGSEPSPDTPEDKHSPWRRLAKLRSPLLWRATKANTAGNIVPRHGSITSVQSGSTSSTLQGFFDNAIRMPVHLQTRHTMNQPPFGQLPSTVVSMDTGGQTEEDVVTQRSYEVPRIIANPDDEVNQVDTEAVIEAISDAAGVAIEAKNDTTNEIATGIDEVSQTGEVSDEIPVISFDNPTTNEEAAKTSSSLGPENSLHEMPTIGFDNTTTNETAADTNQSLQPEDPTTNEEAAKTSSSLEPENSLHEMPIIGSDNTTTDETATDTNQSLRSEESFHEIFAVDSCDKTPNETTTEDSSQDEKLVFEVTMVLYTDNDIMNQVDHCNIADGMCLVPQSHIIKRKECPHVYQDAKDDTANNNYDTVDSNDDTANSNDDATDSDDTASISSAEEDIYTPSESSDENYCEEGLNGLEERLIVVSGCQDQWNELQDDQHAKEREKDDENNYEEEDIDNTQGDVQEHDVYDVEGNGLQLVKRQEYSAGDITRYSDTVEKRKKQKDKEDLREEMIMLGIEALGSILAEKMERKLKKFMARNDMHEMKEDFKRLVELEDDE
ncbi:hypothetical protein BZA77DRAFT_79307 [Pyronema omphalodes]|nr:hypothetical protein BZA77DRAFT_79307 [Pyronema omphalodes]